MTGTRRKTLRRLSALLGLVLFGVAVWVLRRALAEYDPGQILRGLQALPPERLLLAVGLTLLSYLILTGYDALAFRYISGSLPYRRIAFASFLGYAIGNNTGSWSILTGGGIRFRFYAAWGLEPVQITRVVGFCLFSFWVGFLFLGGLVFTLEPFALPASFRLPFASVRPLGVIFLLLVSAYLFLTGRRREATLSGKTFHLPRFPLALGQLVVSSLDWALAGSVLFVLLPPAAPISWAGLLSIFMLAQIAGLVSQVPGGLGVFESVVLLLLDQVLPRPQIAGALLLFRALYYLLPLAGAALLFGLHELLQRRRP